MLLRGGEQRGLQTHWVWRGAEERQHAAVAEMGSHLWITNQHPHPYPSQASRETLEDQFLEGVLLVFLIKTGRLQLPRSRSGKGYSCIVTFSTPAVSPALPVKRSAVIKMHPDKYLPELVSEKNSLDPSFVHAVRLLAEGKWSIYVCVYRIYIFFQV